MPVDEIKAMRDLNRAQKAKEILENELFNEAIESLEAEFFRLWKISKPTEADQRERAWHGIQQVGRLKHYFEIVLGNGQIAASDLQEIARKKSA